jgi:hypothetical protein
MDLGIPESVCNDSEESIWLYKRCGLVYMEVISTVYINTIVSLKAMDASQNTNVLWYCTHCNAAHWVWIVEAVLYTSWNNNKMQIYCQVWEFNFKQQLLEG